MSAQGPAVARRAARGLIAVCAVLAIQVAATGAGLKPEGRAPGAGTPPTTGAHPGPLASKRLAVDAAYRLSAGDVLMVSVFGEPTLSGAFPVGPSGSIAMPILGQLNLRGMTLAEAKATITKKVATLVRHPDVTVTLSELASVRKVYVSGEVMRAGGLTLPFGSALPEALAAAGPGALADLRRIRLTHPGGQPVDVDCSGLRGDGPIGAEHRLEFGDTIYVPRVAEEITVLGEVNAPGAIPMIVGQKVTVVYALQMARGFTPSADRSVAVLLRQGSDPITIDLAKLLTEGDVSEDRELRAGDVLVVHRAATIAVVGQVRSPLVANVAVPVPILQALAQAGGPLATGDLTHAQVVRGGKTITVDLQAFLDKGEAPAELALRPGDVLVVPKGEPQNVLLTGALARTGTFDLRGTPQRDVLRVLTVAGALPVSDLTRVTIYRNQQTLVRNLKAAQEEGALDQNVDLEGGDLVFVPLRTVETVLVTGEVGRRGVLQIADEQQQRDLLRIVTLAGPGVLADLTRVTVHRGEETLTRNLKAAVDEGRTGETMDVQDGDVIVVPTLEQSALITGAVERGGIVRLIDKDRRDLAKVVMLSGPAAIADLTAVTVNRGDQKIVMNIKRYLEDGDRTQTLDLQDGDVVRVPRVEDTILLTGALSRGGTIRLYEGFDRDLGRLVVNAGPLMNADLDRVTVHRGDQKLVRNIRALVEDGDRSQTLELQAGDIVMVPPREVRSILITGAVMRPGLVQVSDKDRRDLARIVTLVGPLPNADLTKVQVHRGELTTLRDVKAFIQTGLAANTLDLEDGDVVVVPASELHGITILGAVMRSGTLQLQDEKERDLLRVITLAGAAPTADLAKVTVYRADQKIVKDIKKLVDEGDRSQTMVLQDGDIVKVPAYEETVLIAGATARTGVAGLGPEPQQRDLARLILTAGPTPYADLRKVTVYRAGKPLPRNVYANLYEGDVSQALRLEDGDVIVVPLDRQVALVTGALTRAGPVKVSDPEDRDLAQILTLTGPLPTADLRRVAVRTDKGETLYDMSGLRVEGKPIPKVEVLPGDTVFVPGLQAAVVLISGAVARQGSLELVLPEQRDLARAVLLATPTASADLTSVIVHRGGEIIVRNLKAYLEKGDQSQTEALQDGDRVLVPQLGTGAGVLVSGQVMNQGILPETIGQNTDLLRAVMLASPIPNMADLTQVTVYRRGQKFVRDLQKLKEEGDLTQNMTLDPGDVVFVPEAKETIVFMGEVERPGPVNIHGVRQRDLAHLLPTAGPKAESHTERVTVYRSGEVIIADYRALVEKGDLTQNIELEAGDLVYVPPDHSHDVMVLGALQRNGPVSVREESNRDLLRLVTMLSPTPLADLSRVTIFRGDQEPMYRDLKLLMDEGDLSQNMQVEPGDVIMVPKMGSVYLFGAVARQGAVPIEPNSTVLDAISTAGGIANGQQRVIVVRRRADGKAEKLDVNLALMATGRPPDPVKVRPGDFLYVPPLRAKKGLTWEAFRDVVWTLSGILNLWDNITNR